MPLLDTRDREQNGLTGALVADLVLTILSYASEQERTWIRQRQREGIDAAHKRGLKFGRPRKDPTPEWYELLEAYRHNRIHARDAAMELNVHPNTFMCWERKSRSLT
jgi:DNA invertase Pin-like site-specific DNA recombinase